MWCLVDQTTKQDILVVQGDWNTKVGEIDYILVKKHFRSGIKTVRTRTFPGADVGSDHDMVMMTFQTRLKIPAEE